MKTLKISFEGIDGSGKSSAMKYFIGQALDSNLNTVEAREVGNPHIPVCQKLREVVLDPNSKLCGESMEFIFSAMRYENELWYNNLKFGDCPPDLVVFDREYFSHLAYTDHNVNREFTTKLYEGLVRDATTISDIVIYLQVDSEVALGRRVRRGEVTDAIELKGVEFQNKVAKSFLYWLDKYQAEGRVKKVYYVNANKTLPEVQMQLDHVLDDILLRRR